MASVAALEEVKDYDDQLKEIIESVSKDISEIANLSGPEKDSRIARSSDRLERLKIVFSSFKAEVRDLDEEHAPAYSAKEDDYNEKIAKLHTDLDWVKSNTTTDRSELFAGAGQIQGEIGVDGQEPTTAQVLAQGHKIQDESLASVARTKAMLAASNDIADETAVKLQGQSEQLKVIGAGVDDVEANLNRADIQIRRFMRKMMTDKLIMCMLFLIICGVIFMIIWNWINPDAGGVSVNDQIITPSAELELELEQTQRAGSW